MILLTNSAFCAFFLSSLEDYFSHTTTGCLPYSFGWLLQKLSLAILWSCILWIIKLLTSGKWVVWAFCLLCHIPSSFSYSSLAVQGGRMNVRMHRRLNSSLTFQKLPPTSFPTPQFLTACPSLLLRLAFLFCFQAVVFLRTQY